MLLHPTTLAKSQPTMHTHSAGGPRLADSHIQHDIDVQGELAKLTRLFKRWLRSYQVAPKKDPSDYSNPTPIAAHGLRSSEQHAHTSLHHRVPAIRRKKGATLAPSCSLATATPFYAAPTSGASTAHLFIAPNDPQRMVIKGRLKEVCDLLDKLVSQEEQLNQTCQLVRPVNQPTLSPYAGPH